MPAAFYLIFHAPEQVFFAAVVVITFIALFEFNRFNVSKAPDAWRDGAATVCGAALPFLVYYGSLELAAPLIGVAAFALLAVSVLRATELKEAFLDASVKTAGIVFIALPLSYLPLLRSAPDGARWTFFMLGIIWMSDTFAYYSGRLFGRRKLSPLISPNKTVEGLMGGLAGGVVAATSLSFYFGFNLSTAALIALAIAITMAGVMGDLAESLAKRAAGVKDSGGIFPGHGGMLDRLDSILPAVPLLYYYLLWIHPL